MRSKTSYFNGTLFRKTLARFWPLWGGASFIGALFPLALLTQLLRGVRLGSSSLPEPLQMTRMYYQVLEDGVPLICLFYGLLCAMAVWSYLFSARGVGGMHILPIRREGLFLTGFLAGYAMVLLPFAVTAALCVPITAAFGLFDAAGVGITVLGVLGESFFYFSSATLAAFITGNLFAMPALYLLLHFLEAILDLMLSNFAGGFLFGFQTDYTGVLECLSPTVYLMRRVDTLWTYADARDPVTGYLYSRLTSVSITGLWLIAVYALAGAVLLAFALALYRRRKSERAGDVVAVGWMRPVFRYGIAALAALLGGQLIYALFWNDEDYRLVPMMVCMLVCGAIGYYGASMLLQKTLRVFRRESWRGLLLVAAGIVVLCGALELDVFGAENRVPEISELRQLEFYVDGNNYTFYPGEADGLLERVREVHSAIAAEKDYIQAADIAEIRDEEYGSFGFVYPSFEYTTKSGRTVRRSYTLPVTRDRLGQSGTYDNLLSRLLNDQEMRLKRIHGNGDGYVPEGGSLYLGTREKGYELSDREAAAILEALVRDTKAERWGMVDLLNAGPRDTAAQEGAQYAIDLSVSFRKEVGDGVLRDWINITLWPEMTATVSCLTELGLAEPSDLVTYRQLRPGDYGEEAKYPAARENVVYPEETLVMANEAEAVIGAAVIVG